jgi:hypothetical protein
MSKTVKFIPSGRGKARCAPDPAYPNGIELDISVEGKASCKIDLPYPAPECGMFCIHCSECDSNTLVTAAGRPDDPISVKMMCKEKVN